ncbi:MAG TPA: hypothetical protein VH374_00805 [Polyangia bacterium]|jgi:hypothetical protein|nr:hypothetical protein [Polyangia bacterium]
MNRRSAFFFFTTTYVLAACSSNDNSSTSAVMVGGATGIAVVNSDYNNSTNVSLFDPATGKLTFDNCLNSGSMPAGLSLTLSGDVVLPSAAQPGHELLLIDRTTAALTYLDPTTCTVKRQFSVGTGFPSDPHDVVALSDSKAYVTRYKPNPAPTDDPNDFDDGDDLLIINPATGAVSGRIALTPFAGQVNGTAVKARPGIAKLISGKVYVALDNLSVDYMTTADGRILVVDPATDTVSGMIDLPGLKNCSGLSALPDGQTLVVTCVGDFNDPMQIQGSAVVAVDLSATPPAIKTMLAASAFGDMPQPLSADSGGALSATTGLVVSLGTIMKTPPDRLWAYDAANTATPVMDATDAFVYGALLTDPEHKQAFMTDATSDKPRVQIIDVSGAPAVKASFDPNPSVGLPPRALGWY